MKKIEDAVRQLWAAMEAEGVDLCNVNLVRFNGTLTSLDAYGPHAKVSITTVPAKLEIPADHCAQGAVRAGGTPMQIAGYGRGLDECFEVLRESARNVVGSGNAARKLLDSADTE